MEQDLINQDASPNRYVRPEHLSASRWLALPQLCHDVGSTHSWQDISVRPEGTQRGFTIALCTNEILEEEFNEGVGPHPRTLLAPGEPFALSVDGMAVYLARPFTDPSALSLVELLLGEAGIPVSSLEEVDREMFYNR